MPSPKRQDLVRFGVLGLLGVTVYHMTLNWGQVSVPAGTTSLIISTVPVLAAILSRWVLNERLSALAWMGFVVSLAGIGVMTFGQDRGASFAVGVGYLLLTAISAAFFTVYVKPVFARYNPIHAMAYITWAGSLPFLLFAPGFVQAVGAAPLHATLASVYIGVFPAGIAYATWGIALSKAPVSRVTPILYLVPPLAILWGWGWAGETPTWMTLVGGTIAMAGVVIVQRWGKARVNPSLAVRA